MWVRSLRKHYDNVEVREEGEEFELAGSLYEHVVAAKNRSEDDDEPPQKDEPVTREQKPARKR